MLRFDQDLRNQSLLHCRIAVHTRAHGRSIPTPRGIYSRPECVKSRVAISLISFTLKSEYIKKLAAIFLTLASVPAPFGSSQTKASSNSARAVPTAKIARGAEPGQPTAPKPETAAHLAELPQPLPRNLTQGIDVSVRSKAILQHLSGIIRYYRMTATPAQKIGEPSDVLYAEQAQTTATQIAQFAFQSARDEAALLARVQLAPGQQAPPATGEAQKLHAAQLRIEQQISSLQQQTEDLHTQITKAPRKNHAELQQQLENANGQLELAKAESEALVKVTGVSTAQTNSGLQGDIDKLQHSIPEVIDSKVKPVSNSIEAIGSLRGAGVVSQAQALFQLLSTRRAIEDRIREVRTLHKQAEDLRTPLVNILRATVEAGGKLQPNANSNSQGQPSNSMRSGLVDAPFESSTNTDIKKKYDQLTDAFKTISSVSIPVSQEILVLEQAEGNLLSWRAAVDSERESILHALLLRVIFIAIALVVVLGIGELWRRGATRYIQDVRHRRQLLVVRRVVIGFLTGLVLIFGFVTQFSSIATFAGLITAGIAVSIQTLVLSVAAYFFIIGRWGVRVGERITVAGVTGDVVDVSLVRLYLMELAGTGAELHPTGRIAVFANSVLFQTGTPLYKQIPGTSYAWHAISLKLKPEVDYQAAIREIRRAIEGVYQAYKGQVEHQYAQTELWLDASLPKPSIEAKLEFSDGLRLVLLFPVPLSNAAQIDQQFVQSIVDLMYREQKVQAAIDGLPVLQAVATK